MSALLEIFKTIGDWTPITLLIVLVGGMAYIIWTLVAKSGSVQKMSATQEVIATNHLTHIQEDINEMKVLLVDIRDGIKILVDRTYR